MEPDTSQPRDEQRIRGWWIWLVAWCIVIAASTAWWWLMAGGFPIGHPRFWVHQVLPPLFVLGAAVGSVALLQRWTVQVRISTLALPIALLAGTITGALLFPASLRGALVVSGAPGLLLGGLWFATRRGCGLRTRDAVIVGAVAAMVGVGVVASQRAPLADTRPLGEAAPPVAGELPAAASLRLGARATVFPAKGLVRVEGRVSLQVAPLLRFISRSPDRFWTLFAPDELHTPEPWRLLRVQPDGPLAVGCAYEGDAQRRLWARIIDDSVVLDASTTLAAPVYSHLNSFTRITIQGHRRLSLEFAAAAGSSLEALPSDYPVGRPLRFAYVDEHEQLQIMSATSGEKGPFHRLATGPLPADAPLVLVLRDEGVPVWRVTLLDWNAQRSRALSPDAGWGVPVATLEFERLGEQPSSAVQLWISLASTSVGRGFDSVGHAAGTYRNRIRIEPLGVGAARAP